MCCAMQEGRGFSLLNRPQTLFAVLIMACSTVLLSAVSVKRSYMRDVLMIALSAGVS